MPSDKPADAANRMGNYPVPEVIIDSNTGEGHISMNLVDLHALAVALHAFGNPVDRNEWEPRLSTPMLILRGLLDRKLVGAPAKLAPSAMNMLRAQRALSPEEMATLRRHRRQELWTQLWYEQHPGDAAGGRIPAMPEELS